MTDTKAPSWDDIRRIADEVRLQVHLAGMAARDRWDALQPRIAEVEKTITQEGGRVSAAVSTALSSIGTTLRQLRDEIQEKIDAARATKG